jgi:hypothetical protein
MMMHGKLVRASSVIVDFVGAIIAQALHDGATARPA